MQNTENKKPEQNFHGPGVSYPLWWNSTSSFTPQSSFTHNLNLNLDAFPEKQQQLNKLGCHYADQDSPSSQSTSHSQHNSGSNEIESLKTNVERTDNSKQMLSLGNGDFLYPAAQANGSQSVIHYPFYGDPFYGSVVAAYGPQPQIQTQLYGIAPQRVPLPDLAEAEPIYVNAKQYRGIMRRRELRAKQEAQNKLVKARKPYLHESRHRHAMNRARGTGGRFLNTKKCQDSEAASDVEGETAEKQSINHLERGLANPENLQRENDRNPSGSTFSSSNSGIPNGKSDMVSDMVFGTYHSLKVGNLQEGSGMLRNGGQPRVPVMR